MSTFTHTRSATFTVTHAKHIASKIAADLNVCSRLHGQPSTLAVENYNDELVELLRYGYLSRYEFGFKREEKRVLSWSYEVNSHGHIEGDERAGKMSAYVDLEGAAFFNYAWYSSKYSNLTSEEKVAFKETHRIDRTSGDPPSDGAGYWSGTEKNYSAGGTGVSRRSFRSY